MPQKSIDLFLDLLNERRMNITELAEASSVHRVTISRLLHKHQTASRPTLERLAGALGVTMARICKIFPVVGDK